MHMTYISDRDLLRTGTSAGFGAGPAVWDPVEDMGPAIPGEAEKPGWRGALRMARHVTLLLGASALINQVAWWLIDGT